MSLGIGAAISAYLATGPGHYPTLLLPGLAVCGLGTGLFTSAFFTSALHHVRSQEIGSAAGLLNAVRQLGATLGVAVLGTLFFSRDIPPTLNGASRAAEAAFLIAGVILAPPQPPPQR